MKRILSLILVLCLLCSLLPTAVFAQEAHTHEPEARVLTEEDYAVTDLVWDRINEKEEELEAKRATPKQRIEAAIAIVEASENYVEGSLEVMSDCFTWKTTEGIACMYCYEEQETGRGESIGNPIELPESGVQTYSYAEKGQPSTLNIYVIGPYYGYQDSFTDHYQTVAKGVAAKTGGTVTVYGGTAANINVIADCVEKGALVLIDSHGTYANSKSYLRLKTGTGLTTADYSNNNAFYGDSAYMVTGTVISNHMDQDAPNSFVWFGICSGMRYNTMHAPLLARGVEATFGYSRTISFHYDRYWLSAFCNSLKAGNTVATAAAAMKSQYGYWDRNDETSYNTYSKAVNAEKAFPIFVTAEDAYPSSLQNYQTVKSTWKLLFCNHPSATYVAGRAASCTTAGSKAYYDCDSCSLLFTDAACTTEISSSNLSIAALGHNTVNGICARCGYVTGITLWHFWKGSTEAGITWSDESTGSSLGVSNNDNGVLYAVSAGGDHYVFPQKGSVSMGHTVKSGDVVEIRYRTTNLPASKIGATGTFELWYTASADQGLSSSRSYSKTVTRAENVWQTVEFTITSGVTINRLCYDVFEDAGGYSGAKFEIDYVYVGPAANKPSAAAKDSVLFDFNNDFPSELRYAGSVYNDRSYDTGFWAGNSVNVKNITFNNADSNVSFEFVDGSNTAYIQTTTGDKTLTATPLNYVPSTGDYVQVRLKMENLQTISGKTASLNLYYIKNNGTAGVVASDCTTITTLTDAQFNGEYLTFSAPLSDSFTLADVINSIRLQLTGVTNVSGKTGKVSVDFIAIAQRDKLPEELPATYTVTFVNYDGTVLETKTVYAGTNAVYGGEEPEHPYDENGHYTFEGWDNSLANINQDSTFTALFIIESHIYTYTNLGNGQHKGDCTCGYQIVANHNMNAGVVTTPADCTANGVMTYTCTLCGGTETEAISALGHNAVADAAVPATCTTAGKTAGSHCATCGATIVAQQVVPATGHTPEVIPGKPAGCLSSGISDGEKCSVCGVITVAQTNIPRLGHSYDYMDNGNGTHTGVCAGCGKTLAAAAHSYEDGKCVCGASDGTVPEGPIDVKMTIRHTLSLGSDISIKYGVVASEVASYDSYYLECSVPNYEGDTLVGYTVYELTPDASNVFLLDGVTAKMMNDEVQAVLCLTKDGKEYRSQVDIYSVATYAYSQLNKANATASLKSVCANLLRYGAMAQKQFNYRTNALVDSNMTAAHKANLTELSSVVLNDNRERPDDLQNPSVTWKGVTLQLGNKVILNYGVVVNSGNAEDLCLRISYVNSENKTVTVDLPLVESSGTYIATYEGLIAAEMRTIVTAAVYNGNTRVSTTYKYSIETYAARSKDAALKELCTAMIAYGDSAEAFFAN